MARGGEGGEPRRVELTLLGQTVTVRTTASAEYLQSLVRYVEARVAELRATGVKEPGTALGLAALDIADELFRARDDHARRDDGLEARLGALIVLLDRATPPTGPSSRAPAR